MKQAQMNISPLAGSADDSLSALWDGELDDAQASRLLASLSDTDQVRWSEFSYISDALHGNEQAEGQFMSRFHHALQDEPTVLAPVPVRKIQPAPFLWTAAAAAMVAVTWMVWTAAPSDVMPAAKMLAAQVPAANEPRQMVGELEPYLAAHQDYAYAVVSMPDLVVEKVSLSEGRP